MQPAKRKKKKKQKGKIKTQTPEEEYEQFKIYPIEQERLKIVFNTLCNSRGKPRIGEKKHKHYKEEMFFTAKEVA